MLNVLNHFKTWKSSKAKKMIPNITVISATDGDHEKFVPWVAQIFGCKCIILIHMKVSKTRENAFKVYGAQMIRAGKNYDESEKLTQEKARNNIWCVISDTSYEGYTEFPKYVMKIYEVNTYEAVIQQNVKPTHVFLQTRAGNLAAGLTVNLFRYLDYAPRINLAEPENTDCWVQSIKHQKPVVCEGSSDTCRAGIACGTASWVAWNILNKTIKTSINISDLCAAKTMRCLKFCKESEYPIEAAASATASLASLIISVNTPALNQKLKIDNKAQILIIDSEGNTDPDRYTKIISNELLSET